VLNKPGALTSEEYQHIKRHCEIGEHILSPALKDEVILKAVRHHHENYDGTGYPDRLQGDEIPLSARIVTVADNFDAMVSERPYRLAMSTEAACHELIKGKNRRFDSQVVDAFMLTLMPSGQTDRFAEIPHEMMAVPFSLSRIPVLV